uniref:Polygalacturonase n=1 Tax=Kalanchoe fedtschenkoi TaxID=63787 RepID=A0A7N0VEZ8_KALFE
MCLMLVRYSSAVTQLDVTNFGAVGDGMTDDTHAFLKAWKAVCSSTRQFPTLTVSEGKTFYVQPLHFQGPCKSRKIHVKMNGAFLAPKKKDWKICDDVWKTFSSINGLTVNGNGKFIGQGASWWGSAGDDDSQSVRFDNCKNLQLSGVTSINSAMGHFSIIGCDRANISGLYMKAPKWSPNTDGIDLSKAFGVVIHNCTMATGDDCISVGGGIKNLTITRIRCGPGHGISIGSLGKYGRYETVENVLVRGCIFTDVQNGARIKTWQGGSGHVTGIKYDNIILRDAQRPIIIDQSYCPDRHCKLTRGTNLKINNVSFTNFRGMTATLRAITLNCSSYRGGCTRVALKNVIIRKGIISAEGSPEGDDDVERCDKVYAYCKNAHGSATATIPKVPCLT